MVNTPSISSIPFGNEESDTNVKYTIRGRFATVIDERICFVISVAGEARLIGYADAAHPDSDLDRLVYLR